MGTPTLITNGATGNVEGRQAFGAFGESIQNAPDPSNTYVPLTGYTGHIQTDVTGLIYMKGRFYSPAWHRFPNSDGGVDPMTENEYAYVRNNPFGATDPTGMSERSRDSQKVKAITAAKVGRTTEQLRKETLQEAKGRLAGVATVVAAGAVVTAGPYLSTAAAGILPRAKELLNKAWDAIKSVGSRATSTNATVTQNKPLGLGSTADLAKGTTPARNLVEQLAIKEAIASPTAGNVLPLKMTDPRWLGSDGWVKMQQLVQPKYGPGVNVHYVRNINTGAIDDFKIVIRGKRP